MIQLPITLRTTASLLLLTGGQSERSRAHGWSGWSGTLTGRSQYTPLFILASRSLLSGVCCSLQAAFGLWSLRVWGYRESVGHPLPAPGKADLFTGKERRRKLVRNKGGSSANAAVVLTFSVSPLGAGAKTTVTKVFSSTVHTSYQIFVQQRGGKIPIDSNAHDLWLHATTGQ